MKILLTILLAFAIFPLTLASAEPATNTKPKYRVLQRYDILVSPKTIVRKVKAPRECTLLFPIDGFWLGQDQLMLLSLLPIGDGTEVTLEGHSDSTGWEGFNLRLAELRAEAVKTALAANFPKAKIKTNSFGSSRPAGDNRLESGRTANRRVVVRFFETD